MPEAVPLGWRVLGRLLPQWYRQRYASELWQVHVDALGGGPRAVRFWLRVSSDVVATAISLRYDALHPGTRSALRSRTSGVDIMRQQLGYALRSLRRAPAFVLTVVITLGLGMGAVVTLFTVLDRLLFSPPEHIVAPENVYRLHVHGRTPFAPEVRYSAALTYPDYADYERVGGFDAIAGYGVRELALDVDGSTARVRAELASASYFPLLGVQPHAGRFFAPEEDRIEGGASVAVLGHGYWQRAFGGAAQVIGRQLRIGKGSYVVIGIAPPGFTGVDIAPVDVWLPLRTAAAIESGTSWRDARRWWWLAAVVRVPPASVATAAAEVTRAHRTGRADVPGDDKNARVVLSPLIAGRGPLASRETQVARLLGGLALLVLLIACANVANLLLARGVQRRRLLAIQTAIGSTRGRLVGQILGESVMLALAAAVVALAFTRLIAPLLFRVLMPDAAMATAGATRTLIFTAAVALAATALVGVIPALRSTRFDVLEVLRNTRESRRGTVLRRTLLFVQAALSALLVIGAGLFVRSLERAQNIDLGVNTNTVAVEFELNDGARSGDRIAAVSYTALERIRALPFVQHAAVTQLAQFQGANGITIVVGPDTLSIDSRPPFFYTATGGYFDAVGLRILRGRPLSDADDRAGAEPVAVISQSLARLAFPTRDPLGQCLQVEPGDAPVPCTRVVGVAEDALPSIRAEAPNLNVYLPPHHPGIGWTAAGTVMVGMTGTSSEQLAAVRAAAAASSGDIRLVEVNPLRNFLEDELRPWRLGAVLLTAFGVLALLVAGAGLYSVLAFDVAQRRFELGVRAALGANARGLVRAVVLRALSICAAGVLAGAAAAALLGHYAGTLLFRVSPIEPRVHVTAFIALSLFAVVAAALPAWHAVRVDPKVALTGE